MRPFEYANPTTVEEALAHLAGGDAAVLAGGTDLLSLMKDDIASPVRLVNVSKIETLRGIGWSESHGLRIGAATTLDELVENAEVASRFPSLIQAVDGVRSPQLRAVGTVGGDLLQRPRCWYYRSGHGLLARLDGRSLVEDGDNRYHAVLGNRGPAKFVHPSSLAPALIALGAQVVIVGPSRERSVALADFYRSPSREGEREADIGVDELLTDVVVPPTGAANATYEVRQKEALDWPLAVAAASLDLDGDVVRSASVVLGHVAPTPHPVPAAAALLIGRAVDEETARAAGEAATEGAVALTGNGYKIRLANVAAKRAILRAAGREVV